ncbi:MAG: DUF177 domain-containing protein [Prevotella sp.]|nr:DUF177 domain-containing protein [Prevotella sp.]
MCSLESFKVDLKGLSATETVREYSLDDSYFEAIDAPEVKSGSLHVSVTIRKSTGFFELLFHTEGVVRIPCNLCLDDMDQPIETDNRLMAKFGTQESEDDEVVIVDENEGMLDLSWLIYEFVALAIPIRHVHAPGKCNPAMLKALEEHSSDRSSDEESNQVTDPRWEALLKVRKEE